MADADRSHASSDWRIIRIGAALSQETTDRIEQAVGARTLERSQNGHLIVDASAAIYLVNAAARNIIADGDGIGIRRGKVSLHRSTDQAKLMQALAENQRTRVLLAHRPSGRAAFSIMVMPMPPVPDLPTLTILIVTDFDRRAEVRAELLAGVFGLTQAETRLALGLLQGKELAQIAKEADKAEATLRSQLRSVFFKAGVHRQVDFVRLALSLPAVRAW